MLFQKNWLAALLLSGTTLIWSCGGDTTASGDGPGGGIGGTGDIAARGPITGFGSIFVNGIEFDTEAATIRIEGGEAQEDSLRVGMVVLVQGTLDEGGGTGRADTVDYADNVEGPVERIDSDGRVLIVLSQKVILGPDTSIVGDVRLGNVVEVSGLVDADGAIRATYVEKKAERFDPGDEIEIKGVVADLNEPQRTFEINGQPVNYEDADTDDLPGGRPQNGQFVEVKSTQGLADGVLLADEVELEEERDLPEDDGAAEIDGWITSVASSTEFVVNETPVDASSATFEDGGPEDIAVNVRVEVEGIVSGGVLVATTVEIKDSD